MKVKRLLVCLLALSLWVGCLPVKAAAPWGMEESQYVLSPEEKNALLSALYEADISAVREALDLGLITCEELTAYYLERIETYNETYNCFITLCDNALEVARQRDELLAVGEGHGLLFGIPVVVKDNIQYAGYPTTNGHANQLKNISQENAKVVERLLEQGAVILGKTNMSTDAQDAKVSRSFAAGETKNAYNPYLASGGSSGGSAVAVSLNFAMAGLGTDTNSSLRYPAALNGCVALRPTKGLLPEEGLLELNPRRDVPGAITRTVYDQAIMLDVLSGGERKYVENLNGDALNGARIGVLRELARTNGTVRREAALDDEIQDAFDNALEELRSCGAEVVEVSLPNLFRLADATFEHDSLASMARFYAAYQELLQKNGLDALVFPTYYHAPQWSGTDEAGVVWNADSQPFINNCREISSCIGVPEISVPIGVHSRGAGIGLEIVADKEQEQLLLDLAYSYTQRYNHRTAPSDAPDLYVQDHSGSLTERIAAYYISLEAWKREEQIRTLQTAMEERVEASANQSFREEPSDRIPAPVREADLRRIWGIELLCAGGLMVCGLLRRRREQRVLVGAAGKT